MLINVVNRVLDFHCAEKYRDIFIGLYIALHF